jgi:hypothetical protein
MASDMAAGRWHMTGEAIKIASDGLLLDGQHRLHAVIKADAPVEMMVVVGIAHEAQDLMDSGRARGVHDVLAIHGEKNANTIASAARILASYPAAGGVRFATHRVPRGELLAFIAGRPGLCESAQWTRTEPMFPRGGVPRSILAACHYLAAPTHRDQYEAFCDSVAAGVNLSAGSPALALVRWNQLSASSRRKVSVIEHYTALVRAFDAHADGRTLTRIRTALGDNGQPPLFAGIAEVPTW